MTDPSPPSPPGTSPGLASLTIAGLLLAAAQAPLGSTMIAVALPSMSQDLHRDVAIVTTFVVTTYLVVNIIAQSPGGKLGDLFGHVRTVSAGMVLIGVGSTLGLLSRGLPSMVVARSLMAVGGAFCVPGAVALLRIHVPRDRQGRIFGLVGATMGLAAAVGPPLGGELVSHFGWRGIFFAPLPVLLVSAVLLRARTIPPNPHPTTMVFSEFMRTFDWPGTVLFAAGLVPLVVAPRLENRRLECLAGSALFLVLFVLRELRAKSPVLDPRLFSNREFTAGSSVIALQNFSLYGLIFQLPQFFEKIRGARPKSVGHVLFFMMIAMFSMSTVGGRLTDRLGARRAALLGMVPALAGMLWVQLLPSFATPSDAIPALCLLGLGLGLTGAPTQSAAVSTIPLSKAGMAAGATATMRYLGGVVSILVLSIILGGGGAGLVANHVLAVRAFGLATVVTAAVCSLLPAGKANA